MNLKYIYKIFKEIKKSGRKSYFWKYLYWYVYRYFFEVFLNFKKIINENLIFLKEVYWGFNFF